MILPPSSSKRKDAPESSSSTARPHSKVAAKEDRRKRGEIACAECRRLKVRCDRQIPCSTCVSRGCMALCPNGTLPPGESSRFVGKSKEHLERKLSNLTDRMRALEDALAIAQAAESSEPHSLLAQPWRFDNDDEPGPSKARVEKNTDEGESGHDILLNSFGRLHINERERSVRFFGPAGGAESLLIDKGSSAQALDVTLHQEVPPTDLDSLGIPEELGLFYHAFPLAPPIRVPRTHARELIETYLPSWERADELCRIFLTHLSWMFQIVSYQELTEDIMPPFYPRARSVDADIPEGGPHDLALLLIVFAIGALVDLSLPPYNTEAQRYHVLARAALALQPLMEKASMSTVKTLHLISIFNGMSGKESNMANTYTVLNLAGRIALRLGLHIDPSNWKMSKKEIYRRRTYFWNLLRADMIQSLGTGRPPALADSGHHVMIPSEEEERAYQEKEIAVLGFGTWGFRYDQECMLPVVRLVTAAKPPSYQVVLDLDRRIRTLNQPAPVDRPDDPNISVSMRWMVRSHFVEIMLMSLHRGFFARAIAGDQPDPFGSPYKYSFITAYQSAVRIIETSGQQFARQPQLLSRIWMIWSINFISALVIGATVTRTKDLPLDPPPTQELNRACELFQAASRTSSRAAAALPVLLAIRDCVVIGKPKPSSAHAASSAPAAGPNVTSRAPVARPPPRLTVPPLQPLIIPASGPPSGSMHPTYVSSQTSSSSSAASQMAYGNWELPYPDLSTYPQYYQQPIQPPSLGQHIPPPPPVLPQPQWGQGPAQHPASSHQHNSVDFILDDSWSSFMQQYSKMGH